MNPHSLNVGTFTSKRAPNVQDSQLLPVLPAHQLQQCHEQARFLVEPLCLANSVAIIGGSPKACKTWLGLELAVAVASGTRCLSHYAVRQPGRALIFLAEDAVPLVRERLVALTSHKGLTLEELDLHVITAPRLRLDLEADRQRLRRTLVQLKPRLLLLDPLVRMHRADELCDRSHNSSTSTSRTNGVRCSAFRAATFNSSAVTPAVAAATRTIKTRAPSASEKCAFFGHGLYLSLSWCSAIGPPKPTGAPCPTATWQCTQRGAPSVDTIAWS